MFICLYTLFPAFITGLLNNIGTHVDPILLIYRIKEGMEIPNLRDSLVKILHDYNLQVESAITLLNAIYSNQRSVALGVVLCVVYCISTIVRRSG